MNIKWRIPLSSIFVFPASTQVFKQLLHIYRKSSSFESTRSKTGRRRRVRTCRIYQRWKKNWVSSQNPGDLRAKCGITFVVIPRLFFWRWVLRAYVIFDGSDDKLNVEFIAYHQEEVTGENKAYSNWFSGSKVGQDRIQKLCHSLSKTVNNLSTAGGTFYLFSWSNWLYSWWLEDLALCERY